SGAVRAAIRTDLIQALAPWLLAARLELPLGTEAIASGRGPAYRVRVGEGAPLVLRICRRGGLAARLLRETYFGLHPRPFPERVHVALLAFDRAWLGAAPLRAAARGRNLRRLVRSLAKLDPGGRLAGAEERRAFRAAYTGHDPRLVLGDACGC